MNFRIVRSRSFTPPSQSPPFVPDECARCVKELDSSHYMHELVKRGVKIAMEQDGKNVATQHERSSIDAMAALFVFLVKNVIISEHQVSKGVDRLHRSLDDLKLDVPAAPALLLDFERLLKEGSQNSSQ